MTGRQLALDLGHRPALGHEDFLVAPSNEEAVLWLDRWPDWPGPALALFGPPGCGKTHLAHVFAAQAGARLTAASSLTVANVPELAEGKAVVVENAGEGVEEQALLHLYNVLKEEGGHLLLTDRRPPARWSLALADLRSRLNAVPIVAIEPPDDALMAAVLVKLFGDRQVPVGEEVVTYLLRHMDRSFAAAREVVEKADRLALSEKRGVTVPLVKRVL